MKPRSKRSSDNRRIAVFCSGEGTNFEAILQAIRLGKLKAKVSVMVSDNPRARAIDRALTKGVPAVVVDPGAFSSREAFDRQLSRIAEKFKARLIILAGFMRILSPWFVRRYRGRILNIHPALLPAFPGARAVRDALRRRAKVTGVTIHFVDEKVDQGNILMQEKVRVKKSDTEKTLLFRIHRVEHRLYPKAIQQVLDGFCH